MEVQKFEFGVEGKPEQEYSKLLIELPAQQKLRKLIIRSAKDDVSSPNLVEIHLPKYVVLRQQGFMFISIYRLMIQKKQLLQKLKSGFERRSRQVHEQVLRDPADRAAPPALPGGDPLRGRRPGGGARRCRGALREDAARRRSAGNDYGGSANSVRCPPPLHFPLF